MGREDLLVGGPVGRPYRWLWPRGVKGEGGGVGATDAVRGGQL